VIRVTCPVPLTEEQHEALMRSVKSCLIHNTLLHPPEIAIQLDVPTAAAQQA
jgi:hypothetical protein